MPKTFVVDGTEITVLGEPVNEQEARGYIRVVRDQFPGEDVVSIELDIHGEEAAMDYVVKPPQFKRIRRITGYLVGDLDRFGNAKRAEEHDRVKHGLTLAG